MKEIGTIPYNKNDTGAGKGDAPRHLRTKEQFDKGYQAISWRYSTEACEVCKSKVKEYIIFYNRVKHVRCKQCHQK